MGGRASRRLGLTLSWPGVTLSSLSFVVDWNWKQVALRGKETKIETTGGDELRNGRSEVRRGAAADLGSLQLSRRQSPLSGKIFSSSWVRLPDSPVPSKNNPQATAAPRPSVRSCSSSLPNSLLRASAPSAASSSKQSFLPRTARRASVVRVLACSPNRDLSVRGGGPQTPKRTCSALRAFEQGFPTPSGLATQRAFASSRTQDASRELKREQERGWSGPLQPASEELVSPMLDDAAVRPVV